MTGNELKQRREALGLSQEMLGRLFDVAPEEIDLWEKNGNGVPTFHAGLLKHALIRLATIVEENGRDDRRTAEAASIAAAEGWPEEEIEETGLDLRRRRKALGMTQSLLAATLGVSTSTIQRWESGEMKPDGERMLELAIRYLERGETKASLHLLIDAQIAALQKVRTTLAS
jgi:transcriptional regulator with XRE-family HTH domain